MSSRMNKLSPRVKKLIGTLVMILFVIFYALIIAAVAPRIVGIGQSKWIEMLFYALAGIAWALPLLPLIRWMERKP